MKQTNKIISKLFGNFEGNALLFEDCILGVLTQDLLQIKSKSYLIDLG